MSQRKFQTHHSKSALLAAIATALFVPVSAQAAEPYKLQLAPVAERSLLDVDLEDIASIKVTSVSRGPESLFTSAAAISVITDEDMRRAGVLSFPDALRLVPGLSVAQQDGHTFAISARGFNHAFANKMLVLIDGRSVYSPLYSGTLWEVQDAVLEDIDRIEVIRGPGATLWGANAVNGVININSKHAKDTQGVLATGGGGTEERGFGSVRYGGKLGEDVWFRLYGKYGKRDDSMSLSGGSALDEMESVRGGFRLDWEPTSRDKITLQGDLYEGSGGQTYVVPLPSPPPVLPPGVPIQFIPPYLLPAFQVPVIGKVHRDIEFSGGNVLGRWAHEFSDTSSAEVRAYYDRTNYDTPIYAEQRTTANLDFQHRFSFMAGVKQEVTWGLGYRHTEGRATAESLYVSFLPKNRTDELLSGFIQDKLSLTSDLQLILGTKVEHNDYTGVEWQPAARLVWTPHASHTVWGSVAQAVRTPSRVESDGVINRPGQAPGVGTIRGNKGFESEELTAYELGYRWKANTRLNFDLALFYNDYSLLRAGRFDPATLRLDLINGYLGQTYGGELSFQWQAADSWRIGGGYSYLGENFEPTVTGTTPTAFAGGSPRNQFFLRSSLDLPGHVTFDTALRYVDELPFLKVPAYITLDARLAWSPSEKVEFAIIGRNLFDTGHREFQPTDIMTQSTEVPRSVFGQVTIRF